MALDQLHLDSIRIAAEGDASDQLGVVRIAWLLDDLDTRCREFRDRRVHIVEREGEVAESGHSSRDIARRSSARALGDLQHPAARVEKGESRLPLLLAQTSRRPSSPQ